MDEWFMPLKRFEGEIGRSNYSVAVSFFAGVDAAGEIQFDFEAMPYSDDSIFIRNAFKSRGLEFSLFSLRGVADDATAISTDDLLLTSLGEDSLFSPSTMTLGGTCQRCEWSSTTAQTAEAIFRTRISGFEGHALRSTTALGTLEMSGDGAVRKKGEMNGMISLRQTTVGDVDTWRVDAEKLVEHVRYVMSFAYGSMFRAPVSEFSYGGEVQISVWSQSQPTQGSFAPFDTSGMKEIFNCAIASFFEPKIDFHNFPFAVEWFAMASTYSETLLINAMTVMENMLSSHLDDSEKSIQPEAGYARLKKIFSKATREYAEATFEQASDQGQFRCEINEKFIDLNRKSLKQKIDILAARWHVALDGLSEDQIKDAKRARDLVVHEGKYTDRPNRPELLINHAIVARELVVRFILTALGFEGKYNSYVGGLHQEAIGPTRTMAPPA